MIVDIFQRFFIGRVAVRVHDNQLDSSGSCAFPFRDDGNRAYAVNLLGPALIVRIIADERGFIAFIMLHDALTKILIRFIVGSAGNGILIRNIGDTADWRRHERYAVGRYISNRAVLGALDVDVDSSFFAVSGDNSIFQCSIFHVGSYGCCGSAEHKAFGDERSFNARYLQFTRGGSGGFTAQPGGASVHIEVFAICPFRKENLNDFIQDNHGIGLFDCRREREVRRKATFCLVDVSGKIFKHSCPYRFLIHIVKDFRRRIAGYVFHTVSSPPITSRPSFQHQKPPSSSA